MLRKLGRPPHPPNQDLEEIIIVIVTNDLVGEALILTRVEDPEKRYPLLLTEEGTNAVLERLFKIHFQAKTSTIIIQAMQKVIS